MKTLCLPAGLNLTFSCVQEVPIIQCIYNTTPYSLSNTQLLISLVAPIVGPVRGCMYLSHLHFNTCYAPILDGYNSVLSFVFFTNSWHQVCHSLAISFRSCHCCNAVPLVRIYSKRNSYVAGNHECYMTTCEDKSVYPFDPPPTPPPQKKTRYPCDP